VAEELVDQQAHELEVDEVDRLSLAIIFDVR